MIKYDKKYERNKFDNSNENMKEINLIILMKIYII